MGRIFLQHMGGTRLFCCVSCGTCFTNGHELVSTRFRGNTSRALLFNKVVNVTYTKVFHKAMQSGSYLVRGVSCKKCGLRVGWTYEYAAEPSQEYKEGRTILDESLMTELEGIEEKDCDD